MENTEIRKNAISVTYFNDQGDTVVRVINTAMTAEQVKNYLPIIPARIEKREWCKKENHG
jgi:hypothetical protein